MASPRAVAVGLATLHEAYPTRAITAQTAEVWQKLLVDLSDDQFLDACQTLAVERGRTFFPTPGELMAVAAPPVVVDADAMLRRISGLGAYNPNVGWIYPRVGEVRAALGEGIARAYAEAGASRCFADTDRHGLSVTRDIARATFAKVLREEAQTLGADRRLTGGTAPRLLSDGSDQAPPDPALSEDTPDD